MAYERLGPLLDHMLHFQASDMYLTYSCPPSLRLSDRLMPLNNECLSDEHLKEICTEILDEQLFDEFESTLEYNTSLQWNNARFRVNLFYQQQHIGIVIRRINMHIPSIEELQLPQIYADLVMQPRGLILVVGQTGSGKSTSLAAMVGHRNRYGTGHIITIEDPIEFIHQHEGCIISQRDVGIDTYSFGIALKNALRQRPDVVLIGEIRDRETMEHAINFSETGHLCLATLHANNANQAIERILSFFPEEKHLQVRMNLAMNLKAILSQRLILNVQQGRNLAVEVMLNRGLIRNLIEEGKVREIKAIMERSTEQGMCTFDQSIFDLFARGLISEEIAVSEADNNANMKLNIKQIKTVNHHTTAAPEIAPLQSEFQQDNKFEL